MEARRDRRSLRPVDAAPRAVVVPGEGATAAHFVAPSSAPCIAAAAGAASFGERVAPTLALFSAQRRVVDIDAERMRALAVGDEPPPAAKAPWEDHEFRNPPTVVNRKRRDLDRAERAQDRRRKAYILRDALRTISSKRVQGCGRRRIAAQVEVVRRPYNGVPGKKLYKAHFRGLLRCGSVWECPVCAMQIRAERSREVEAAVTAWGIERVVMLSLTVRHGLGHDLCTVRKGIANAFRRLINGAPWTRFKAKYGLRHFIRAMEVTHGPNGWHPHLHIQVFLDAPLDDTQAAAATDWLSKRWLDCVLKVLGAEHAPDSEHGVNLRPTKRGDYAFKMALELVEAGTKRGRPGHRTPWQIAADYAAHGRDSDAVIWRSYTHGMRGAQMHHWSRGLREAIGLGAEDTEQDIVNGEQLPDDEVVAVLDPSGWAAIAARGAECTLAILAAAEACTLPSECDSAIRQIVGGKARGS
jgi:hypothetical protein